MKFIKFTIVYIISFMMLTSAAYGRNVILIVPDGCSIPIWSAVRAMTVGVDSSLNIDRFPIQGRCKTYSANAMITDSAAAGTAFACGIKTNNGVLGMTSTTTRGDSLTGQSVESILETAQKKGYATGLVTTASIPHATPAAFFSHRADRNWYELIAHDMVDSGVDIIMGGGREYMIPKGTKDEEGAPSKRSDNRNIIEEMKNKDYEYIHDLKGFESIDIEESEKLLCLFNPGHMNYELDRGNDVNGEPGLREMTNTALKILSRNKKGFFLLIEAGRIDHAAHIHDTDRFLYDGIACDKAVGVALDFANKNKNTLVIVVPDHGTGGPYFVGVNGVNGEVISYDKAGFIRSGLDESGYPVDNGGKPIAMQWIEWKGHTGEDVGYFAMVNRRKTLGSLFGVKNPELGGLIDNTDVYKVMSVFLKLSGKK
ncbi:alkaline phosphatase [Candidatus Latescibacterota bacterium]